jgi:hypothetical protein
VVVGLLEGALVGVPHVPRRDRRANLCGADNLSAELEAGPELRGTAAPAVATVVVIAARHQQQRCDGND